MNVRRPPQRPDPWEAIVAGAESVGPPSEYAHRHAHRVAVLGGVGGAGTTTVACGIALARAATGEPTLLVEFDLDRGGLAGAWGIPPARTIGDLDAVSDEMEPAHVAMVTLPHTSGVSVLLAPARPGAAAAWDEVRAGRLMECASTLGGSVLDCGSSLGPHVKEACAVSDQVIIVAPPTLAAACRVRALLGVVRGWRPHRQITLLANLGVGHRHLGTRAFARTVDHPVHGTLRRSDAEAEACLSGRRGRGRRSRLSRAFAELAQGGLA